MAVKGRHTLAIATNGICPCSPLVSSCRSSAADLDDLHNSIAHLLPLRHWHDYLRLECQLGVRWYDLGFNLWPQLEDFNFFCSPNSIYGHSPSPSAHSCGILPCLLFLCCSFALSSAPDLLFVLTIPLICVSSSVKFPSLPVHSRFDHFVASPPRMTSNVISH